MDYFSLGSEISYPDYNALVYLLRKFKRLTSDLKLGSSTISSDYGTYSVTGGLTSVGGNFILEDDVTVSSSDVLLNCFYTFYFTVVDVNLSGTVNRRVISVTGDTGDNGELEVTLSPDLLEDDEVILPDFKVDIVFDPHEYYTPVTGLHITLEVDKLNIDVGETNTVTATVLNDQGEPVSSLNLSFNVNGDIEMVTTDNDGVASLTYTGTGVGWVNVTVSDESIRFYDGELLIAEFTGNSIKLGFYAGDNWLPSVGDVVIDWGDGTTSIVNNPTTSLTHNYTDGVNNHDITFIGNVTSIGNRCFVNGIGLTSVSIPNTVTSLDMGCFSNCTGLTSVTIPDSVTSLGMGCFNLCTSLTSVVIPSSVTSLGEMCFLNCTGLTSLIIPSGVTSIGRYCFGGCSSLVDYELYWTDTHIIPYDSSKMPNNTNSLFIIPVGETSNYISKGYPSAKIVERGYDINITADKPIIQSSETSTITATLKHDGRIVSGETLTYTIKHGATTIASGTDTTDNNGEIDITYTGTAIGEVTVEVKYSNLLQETYVIYDSIFADIGVTGKHNTNWWNTQSTGITITTDDSGTTVANTATSGYSRDYSYDGSTLPSSWNEKIALMDSQYPKPFVVEFNLVSLGNSNGMFMGNGSTTITKYFSQIGATSNSHIRIVCDGSTAKFYVDGTLVSTDNYVIGSTSSFALMVSNQSSLKYRDLCIYPLEDVYDITITGNDIIQTGDTDTITAILSNNGIPVTGETLTYEIKHGSTIIDSGTDTTDSNGQITISYTGTGVGDVSVIVSYGSLLQETFVVQDCHYWNDGSSVTGLEIGTGVSCTSNGDYITITTDTSGEKDVKIPVTLTGNWEFETELADLGTTNDMTFKVGSGQQWGATSSSRDNVLINFGGTTQYFTKTINVGSVLKITYNNGTMTAYWNNDQLTSETVTVSGKMGYYTNSGRVQKIKNIKLKAL